MKKKWIFRILICLILGVVTTVGVAWTLVYNDVEEAFASTFTSDQKRLVVFREEEIRIVQQMDPRSEYRLYVEQRQGVSTRSIQRCPPSTGRLWLRWTVVEFLEAGWPVRGLRSEIWHDPGFGKEPSVRKYSITFSKTVYWNLINKEVDEEAQLPLRPLFPGFLINTLFYAALWFGLFFGVGSTRRFIRTWRGRCPRCGYDLRGALDDGCTECGWNRASRERA